MNYLQKIDEGFITCLPVCNNLCRKLVSLLELPIIFDDSFIVTSAAAFFSDFNLLSCELDSFAFTLLC